MRLGGKEFVKFDLPDMASRARDLGVEVADQLCRRVKVGRAKIEHCRAMAQGRVRQGKGGQLRLRWRPTPRLLGSARTKPGRERNTAFYCLIGSWVGCKRVGYISRRGCGGLVRGGV